MLHYIYTDEVHIDSCRAARGLCLAAHRYALPHLRARCAAYLLAHLEPASACDTYEFAEQIDDEQLRDACLQMMRDRTLEVLEAGSWVEAREETVARVFALDELSIESELQLLAAAERSARARAPARTEGAEQSPLRGAVQNIRFLTLAPEEFAKHPTPKALLTDAEILAILTNLATSDAPVPMPSGFSTSRTSRVRRPKLKFFTPGRSSAILSQSSQEEVTREAALVVATPIALSSQLCVGSDNVSRVSSPPSPQPSAGELSDVTRPKEESFFKSLFLRRQAGTSDIFDSGDHNSRTEASVRVIVALNDLPRYPSWFHSPAWCVGYLPWRLRVSRYPNASDVYIGVDCNWEDRSGWALRAEGVVRLVPHKTGVAPRLNKFNNVFERSSDNFFRSFWYSVLDPAAGFVRKNKITFEVTIKLPAS